MRYAPLTGIQISADTLRAITMASILLLMGGCGTPAYEQDYRQMPQTLAGAEEYLRKYPDSPHSAQLRSRLPQLTAEEQARRQRAEEQARLARVEQEASAKRGASSWNAGDYAAALRLAKEALEQGDAKANFVLAIIYWNGQGVDADYERALAHMKASGEKSLADVMQTAVESYRKSSACTPALKVPRGGLIMRNEGSAQGACFRVGLNPTSIR